MPKPKQKQKQKQKQSQVTKVSVRVGDTSKPKRRPRSVPQQVPQRQPTSIGLSLQGSSVVFPPAPIQPYNELVQQNEALRRQLAQSGSLIPRAETNDMFNRVKATNPFEQVSTMIPMASLIRPEGVVEEAIEGSTTIDPTESHGFAPHIAIDQDWIRNVALANRAQSLETAMTQKVGVVEDPETIKDIDDYDDENVKNQSALVREYGSAAQQRNYKREQALKSVLGTEDLEAWDIRNKMFAASLQEKLNASSRQRRFKEAQARFSMTAEDIFSKQIADQNRREQELAFMRAEDVRSQRPAMSKKQRASSAAKELTPERFTPSGKVKGRPKKYLREFEILDIPEEYY